MTIEALQEKRATLLATARELAAGDGDMARVKSLMAESEEVGQRIEAIKSLGELAPKPTNVASSEPWSRGGVTKNVFSGTRDEANRKAYTMGQIALSLMGNGKASNWLKENGIKAQSEGTNNVGGFLVPDPLSSDLIYLREQFGIARRYCRVVVGISGMTGGDRGGAHPRDGHQPGAVDRGHVGGGRRPGHGKAGTVGGGELELRIPKDLGGNRIGAD